MSVKLVVAVTDADWFRYLRVRSDLAEVNFWAPSGTNFRALSPGELFLFKLHAPLNFIVGGGVFAHASTMPCSLAWEAFGEANGATTLAELAASGTPAILVPLPTSTDDHQRKNAAVVAQAGAAIVIDERVLSAEALAAAIASVTGDADRRRRMSAAARALARPDAAARIADRVEQLALRRSGHARAR